MNKISLFFLLLIFSAVGLQAQLKMKKTRILIVVDASNSMIKNWNSRSKMDASRVALSKFIDKCKTYGEIELAMRVYGHQYPTFSNRCDDSKLEIPFGINNGPKIKMSLNALNPKGTSAVGYALKSSLNDFQKEDFHDKVVIFLTDGADACKQDVCDSYLVLKNGLQFKGIYIIGMNMNDDEMSTFSCIEDFVNVSSDKSLISTLDKIFGEIKPY